MIALEARNLTKVRTLPDKFDPEETFNELRYDPSAAQQLACHAARTALANTEPYKNHPLAIEAKIRNRWSTPPPLLTTNCCPKAKPEHPPC